MFLPPAYDWFGFLSQCNVTFGHHGWKHSQYNGDVKYYSQQQTKQNISVIPDIPFCIYSC
jgi:hypothetical protein